MKKKALVQKVQGCRSAKGSPLQDTGQVQRLGQVAAGAKDPGA